MSPGQIATIFAFACFTAALVMNLWRLLRGPALSDRLVAMDTMTMNIVALLTLIGMATGQPEFMEAALLYAMFGFVATLAFARFGLRREGGV